MLTKILSITGRPGLYKLISTNQNMNIVESLIDGKRIPVYMHEKIVALSDVSMYTNDGDIPLKEVFKKIKEKENSKPVLLNSKSSSKELFSFLIEVLPEYNKESVYASDVKKLISWYNILIEKGIDFETEESKTEENELEEHAENESEL
ncbi:MAG TPA: DUF5606 domain-containing protein [Fermentimonas caenicola]|jgi:hypothetical protein|uniref:DUF5606 domain-containing protein n=1 Tax=Fermentimonas caenicola TaxID=1562970 RepID=A0A098C0P1_9BACT|nr:MULTISPECIES: DUF5606 domain-containing protein [Lascolabacillus]MBP6175575.1 DUF5606 domain-containing protein [Fermentimonas sp.]MDI9626374.1 DUF5606 domain-containing protein [Bacteroidota bacterium]TAH61962.1 MAG: hypothetical protein EWM46_03140 [Fermentimonas caenicola]MBP6195999.1 DUF5606 domain-containing protein [Fermentimonas sp.]MBP7104210.1 DUF5606 domain-containing protein [Fermentimonas sp.]